MTRPTEMTRFSPLKSDMPEVLAVLVCSVGGDRRLTACRVETEQPRGWGFAAWVQTEAQRWRVVTERVESCPVVGRFVGIKVRAGYK